MHWIVILCLSFLYAEDPLNAVKALFCPSLPEDTQFTPLPGLTNKSYLFAVDEKSYVIRLPGRGTQWFIDRSAEHTNNEQAYFHGFSPTNVVSFDPATGRQVTLFVSGFKGFKFEEFYHDDLIEKVAQLLREIHTSSLVFTNSIDLFDRMDQLGLHLQEQGIALPPEYQALRAALQKWVHFDCFEALPSHGDPVPSNFILLDKKLMLFDWEYSGLNDPGCDLAFLSTVMNYSKDQEEALLFHYGSTPISLLKEKIIYFKPIIESWLGLWGILQTASCSESQKDFFEMFSTVRFKRAEKVLHSEEHARAVALLSSLHRRDGKMFLAFPIDPRWPLLASFPQLSDQVGLTQIEFGLWICPYCGILNPMTKRCCMCPSCPLK